MIAISLVMALCTSHGMRETRIRFPTKPNGDDRCINIIQGIELILVFLAWSKQDTFWRVNDTDAPKRAHYAIRKLMAGIAKLIPRDTGSKWNTTKFHEFLHMIFDILRNGSPNNTHSGPMEALHKYTSVNPALTSQFQRNHFEEQLANRLADHLVIERAYREMNAHELDPMSRLKHDDQATSQDANNPTNNTNHNTAGEPPLHDNDDNLSHASSDDPVDNIAQSTSGSSNCFVTITTKRAINGSFTCHFVERWKSKSKNLRNDDTTIDFIIRHLGLQTRIGTHEIQIITEYRRDIVLFRSHPNHRKKGPWRDWVMVQWEAEDDDENIYSYYTPSQILCFFYHKATNNQLYALVHPCEENGNEYTTLTHKWTLEKEFQVVTVDSLQEHVCIFPFTSDKDGDPTNIMIQLRSKDTWKNLFVEDYSNHDIIHEEVDEHAPVRWDDDDDNDDLDNSLENLDESDTEDDDSVRSRF